MGLLAFAGSLSLSSGAQCPKQFGQWGFAGLEGLFDVAGALAQQHGALGFELRLGFSRLQLRACQLQFSGQPVADALLLGQREIHLGECCSDARLCVRVRAERQAQRDTDAALGGHALAGAFLAQMHAQLGVVPALDLGQRELALGAFDGACSQLKLRMGLVEIEAGCRAGRLRLSRNGQPGQPLPLGLLGTQLLLDFRFLRLAGEPLGARGHGVCRREVAGLDATVHVLGETLEKLVLKRGQTVL